MSGLTTGFGHSAKGTFFAGLLTATALSPAFAQNTQPQQVNMPRSSVTADDVQCLSLLSGSVTTHSAGGSAEIHSEANPGTITLAVNPGADLYDLPQKIVASFRRRGDLSDCFINNSLYTDSGSSYSLYVNGQRVHHQGENSFNFDGLLADDKAVLRKASTEATLGRSLSMN